MHNYTSLFNHLLTAVVFLSFGNAAKGQTQFFGPVSYFSQSDTPPIFNGTPTLEDFEDGELTSGVSIDVGSIQSSSGFVDSVDADDGIIDGCGADGSSYGTGVGTTEIRITFDDTLLGGFPTAVSLVWTDGVGDVIFEAFGPGDISLGSIGPVTLGDENESCGTLEDRLFAVLDNGGIETISIRSSMSGSNNGLEIDHLQFGTMSEFIGLCDWESVEYDNASPTQRGQWEISEDCTSLTQLVNGAPTFYISDFDFLDSTFDGQFRVDTTEDTDFIGFVFGFEGLAEDKSYYLFYWKQHLQFDAEEGMKLVRIDGIPDGIPSGRGIIGEMADGENSAHVTVLAENIGPGTGWEDFTTYRFKLTYLSNGTIRVLVFNDQTGALVWNSGQIVDNDPIGIGKIGFYNASQQDVVYSGFTTPSPFPVSNPGGPYFVDATNQLVLDGSLSFDPDGLSQSIEDISLFEWDLGSDGSIEITSLLPQISVDVNDLISAGLGVGEVGELPITLIVTDADELTNSESTTVVYQSTTSTVDAGGPYGPINPGQSITFANASCNDPDALVPGHQLIIEWDTTPATAPGEVGDGFLVDTAGNCQLTASYDMLASALGQSVGTIYLNAVDESGNFTSSSASVSLNLPDLQVATVSAPSSRFTGQSLDVAWLVQNTGPGGALGVWADQVYISTNETFGDADDLSLGSIQRPNDLPSGDEYTNTHTFVAPSEAGEYWVFVVTDGNGNGDLLELDELNNISVPAPVTVVDPPDLVVALFESDSSSATIGIQIQLNWTIHNDGGSEAVGPWSDRVYLSDDGMFDASDILLSDTLVTQTDSGEEYSQSVPMIVPNRAGQQFLILILDAENNVDEFTGESNNTAVVPFEVLPLPTPDILVSGILAASQALGGSSITVEYTVSNVGEANAPPPWTDSIYLSADEFVSFDDTRLLLTPVGQGLAPDQSRLTTRSVVLPPRSETSELFLLVHADDGNTLDEFDEENNTDSIPITVLATPKPDLTITDASLGAPGPFVWGETIDIQWQVFNQSSLRASGNWSDVVLLSTDDQLSPDDRLLTSVGRLGGLDESDTYEVMTTAQLVLTNGSMAGSVYVLVLTDGGSVIDELNEDNNLRTLGPIDLVLPELPNLIVENVRISTPDGASPGSSLVVEWTLRNTGNAPAPGDWLSRVAISQNTDGSSASNLLSIADAPPLDPNESAEQSATIFLPDIGSSSFTVVVVADAAGDVIEENNADNFSVSPPVQYNRPDLAITDTISFPSDALADEQIDIHYRVENIGEADVSTLIAESISFSANDSVGSDVLLTTQLQSSLAQGASGDRVVTITIPQDFEGDFAVVVSTDVTDAINEGGLESNNTKISLGTITVNQPDRPNLVVASIDPAGTSLVGAAVIVEYTVQNVGLNAASGIRTDRVSIIDFLGNEVSSAIVAADSSLSSGQVQSQTASITAPSSLGVFSIAVQVDSSNAIFEGVFGGELDNDLTLSSALTTEPFIVQLDANFVPCPDALPGAEFSCVEITGVATDSSGAVPAVGVTAAVEIETQGFRRILTAETDSLGEFGVLFQPGPTEGGVYRVRGGPPNLIDPDIQDSFTIWSLSFAGVQGRGPLVRAGTPTQSLVTLSNPGDLGQGGISASVVSMPAGITATLSGFPSTMPGNSSADAVLTIQSDGSLVGTAELLLEATSSDGSRTQLEFPIQIANPSPELTASPDQMFRTMLRGERSYAQFEVINSGSGSTGEVEVLISDTPWLSLATSATIPSVGPGDSASVVLQLDPAVDLPLGDYTGSVTVTDGITGVQVPFRFRAASSGIGSLQIVSTDQGTYYDDANGFPNVPNARVRLYDHATLSLIADGFTNNDGMINFDGLTEAYYEVEVSAPRHGNARFRVLIIAGDQVNAEAFLPIAGVSYSWQVIPVFINDSYDISIETTFETNVPAPIVVFDPPVASISGISIPSTYDITIKNMGLITAPDVRIRGGIGMGIEAIPLVDSIGDLAPGQSVSIPFLLLPSTEQIASDPDRCGWVPYSSTYTLLCGGDDREFPTEGYFYDWLGCVGTPPPPPPGPPGGPGGPSGDCDTCTPPEDPIGPNPNVVDLCDICVAPCLRTLAGVVGLIPFSCSAAVNTCFNNLPTVQENAEIAAEAGKCTASLASCSTGIITELGDHIPVYGQLSQACRILRDCVFVLLDGCDSPAGDIPCSINELVAKGIEAAAEEAYSDGLLLLPTSEDSEYEFLQARLDDSLALLLPGAYVLGDGIWFEVAFGEEVELFDTWLTLFNESVETNSLEGRRISQAEMMMLQSLPTPPLVTPSVTTRAIERWNRSVSYWALGFGSLDDLPDGFDPDFIDPLVLRLLASKASDAVDNSRNLGLGDPFNALGYATTVFQARVLDQSEGVCAQVRLQIDQRLTLTRSAFRAELTVDNTEGMSPLDLFSASILIRDIFGNDASDKFGIYPPDLTGIPSIDGTASILPGDQISAGWLIVPNDEAAPDGERTYFVSGSFGYVADGVTAFVPLLSTEIRVQPNPNLRLKYFLERNAVSDDPFTPQLEPPVPFSLGLIVSNTGLGEALSVGVSSGEPQIIENDRGLLLDIDIIGTIVGDQSLSPALDVNLGDIPGGETAVAQWIMISTLSGTFTDFSASFEHIDPLGDPRLSLIESIETFDLDHVVLDPRSSADSLPDFFFDAFPDPEPTPDRLYRSDDTVHPVESPIASFDQIDPITRIATIDTNPFEGYGYIRLDDPFNSALRLMEVHRADGRQIFPGPNAWQTNFIRRPIGQPEHLERRVHIFDHNNPGGSSGRYTLTFDEDSVPPEVTHWASIADHAGSPVAIPLVNAQQRIATEPRDGSVGLILAEFSEPVDPSTVFDASVSILAKDAQGNEFDPHATSTVTVTLAINAESVNIHIEPALPDDGTYCVTLVGVKDLAGNDLLFPRIRFRTLLGDLTSDSRVNSTDIGAIASRLDTDPINPLDPFDVRSDVDRNGVIDSSDLTVVLLNRGLDLRGVTPPCQVGLNAQVASVKVIHSLRGHTAQLLPLETQGDQQAQDDLSSDPLENTNPTIRSSVFLPGPDGTSWSPLIEALYIAVRTPLNAQPPIGILGDENLAVSMRKVLSQQGNTDATESGFDWWVVELAPSPDTEFVYDLSYSLLDAECQRLAESDSSWLLSPVLRPSGLWNQESSPLVIPTGRVIARFREQIPSNWIHQVITMVIQPTEFSILDWNTPTGGLLSSYTTKSGYAAMDSSEAFMLRPDVENAEPEWLVVFSSQGIETGILESMRLFGMDWLKTSLTTIYDGDGAIAIPSVPPVPSAFTADVLDATNSHDLIVVLPHYTPYQSSTSFLLNGFESASAHFATSPMKVDGSSCQPTSKWRAEMNACALWIQDIREIYPEKDAIAVLDFITSSAKAQNLECGESDSGSMIINFNPSRILKE